MQLVYQTGREIHSPTPNTYKQVVLSTSYKNFFFPYYTDFSLHASIILVRFMFIKNPSMNPRAFEVKFIGFLYYIFPEYTSCK
jgi:hypothetical protein